MPNYRPAKFGMVSVDVLDPSMNSISENIKIYLRTAAQEFEYLKSPKSIAEIIRYAKQYMADDFQSWLSVNFDKGTGVRAEMVRRILGFISGSVSGQLLVEGLRIDQRKIILCAAEDDFDGHILRKLPRKYDSKWDDLLDQVTNDDFYKVVEGIGPQALAIMLLTFNGDCGDV